MHRITLLSVGKIKTRWISEGCRCFEERISRLCRWTMQHVRAGSPVDENDRLRAALEKASGTIVVLDSHGTELSSEAFARWLGREHDAGRPVTFVVGGAYGLDDDLRARGTLVLSLSRMTLPHELCILIFLEQLYRALDIARGGQYHHGATMDGHGTPPSASRRVSR